MKKENGIFYIENEDYIALNKAIKSVETEHRNEVLSEEILVIMSEKINLRLPSYIYCKLVLNKQKINFIDVEIYLNGEFVEDNRMIEVVKALETIEISIILDEED